MNQKRVILVGALYPMSIAVEFQTDLISFGKTVLQYHTYDKDMIFNENDYVIFTSSSGSVFRRLYVYKNKSFITKYDIFAYYPKIQPIKKKINYRYDSSTRKI